MVRKYKMKKKSSKKLSKTRPRKSIDRKQNKEILALKKKVSQLTNVKEPELIDIQKSIQSSNCTNTPMQIRLTNEPTFKHYVAGSGNVHKEDFREGNQITIGNINCCMTFYDLNNNFNWRILVCQYPDRPDIVSRNSPSSAYAGNDELKDMLKYYTPSALSLTREQANMNIQTPHKLHKLRKHKCITLYDRVITGKYRELKLQGVGNETRTIKFVIKPKIRKLTFEKDDDRSPIRGDVVMYLFNDYGFYGTWSSHHDNTQKYKSVSARFWYNVYDE